MVGQRYFQRLYEMNVYVELIFKNTSLLHSTLTINGTRLNPRLRIECSRSGQQLSNFQSKLISQFEMNNLNLPLYLKSFYSLEINKTDIGKSAKFNTYA